MRAHFQRYKQPKMRFPWSLKSDDSSLRKSFSASWQPQNSTLLRSRKRCFNWLHALWTHFLPIEHAKMLLGWCREDDVSKAPMSFWNHFRPQDHPKMQIGWDRKIDVSRAHMVLSTYFRDLDQPKLDLGEVEKAMLQVLACHFELI